MASRQSIYNYDSDANTGPQRTIGSAKKVGAISLDSELEFIARGLVVGGAGNVNLRFVDGTTHVLPVVQGWNPVEFVEVLSSGTTATNIHYYI